MLRSLRLPLAALTLMVPLGTIAWVGSVELRRAAEQAENAVEQQAFSFLRAAATTLERRLSGYLPRALDEDTLGLSGRTAVQATRELRERLLGQEVLDLILLDENGVLVHPRPGVEGLGLPMLGTLREPALARVQLLLDEGRYAAALVRLDRFLVQNTRQGRQAIEDRVRAAFLRGAVLRRMERIDEARIAYRGTLEQLEVLAHGPLTTPDLEGLHFLSLMALAEMHESVDQRLALMRAISEGLHDNLPDTLLAGALDRLLASIPEEAPERAVAQEAMVLNRYREGGRKFATEYRLILEESVRRRLRASTVEPIQQVFQTGERTGLLALRTATPTEHSLLPCKWVGLHLDLTALLHDQLAPFLEPDPTGFTLEILDPDGLPLLRAAPEVDFEPLDMPTLTTESGIVLRAIPSDSKALVSRRRTSLRNRALLLVALVLLAFGGAALLWQYARRETALARLKVDLLSRVSHELRTPLSLVRMYGETLARGRTRDGDQAREFAAVITREAERLSAMIERILDFSRAEAGSLVYEPEDTDLGEATRQVVDAYRRPLAELGGEVAVDLAEDLTAHVDPNAYASALVNLLENAAKYTPADAADRTVEVRLRGDGTQAVLEVLDRGPGVPDREKSDIFNSFYRASNSGSVRGAGLGLALVAHFVHAHGGSARVADRPGGGSIMRLTLPLVANHHGPTDEHPGR